MNNPFVGFVPWIIFWVVASPSTWEYATLGALIAAVILAQNSHMVRRLRTTAPILVLPNATAVDLNGVRSQGQRTREILLVGRMVAWKGGRLALRALRHVTHPEAVLRVYGDGPDRRRWPTNNTVGDIPGITARVDYLAELGVETQAESAKTALAQNAERLRRVIGQGQPRFDLRQIFTERFAL